MNPDNSAGAVVRALLALLRAGLWECAPAASGCFPLSSEAWGQLYRLARRQTVTGIVFSGLQRLPDDLMPPEALLVRWAAEVDAIERRNRAVDAAVVELTSFFRSKGLNPILQKGQGVALCYADPALRESGDIDFYFAGPKAFSAAVRYIRMGGVSASTQPDGSIHYRWRGIDVEHHRRLLDLHNPMLRSYAAGLASAWGNSAVELHSAHGSTVSVPSPPLCLLLLNLHILKHAVGRGIGLRQLCDLARACHVFSSPAAEAEFVRVSRRLGLGRWDALLHAFLVDSLGLDAARLPYPRRASGAADLSAIVWRGGNFGFYSSAGRRSVGASARSRKLLTARSFLSNLRFSFRYAPKESLWIMAGLVEGQFR